MLRRTAAAPAASRHGRNFRRLARTLAKRLRRLRIDRGWTKRTAASYIGIGTPVLRRLEDASANPSLAVLVSIARTFGIKLCELLRA